ncbi:MAG: hypothetical protein QI223_07920 [Candidatus Korarchaeota archaeon]|nr:hypothetical protein [Candidatus Korarchaeota archaeon]
MRKNRAASRFPRPRVKSTRPWDARAEKSAGPAKTPAVRGLP